MKNMGKHNWCVNCGHRIPNGAKSCPLCQSTQISNDLNDPFILKEYYKDLVFKQSTEGLSNEEQKDMEQCRDKIKRLNK